MKQRDNFIFVSVNDAVSNSCGWVVGGWCKVTWKDCGRKQVVSNMRYCYGVYMDELKKTTKNVRVVTVPVKIWTGHIQNSGQGSLIVSPTQGKDKTYTASNYLEAGQNDNWLVVGLCLQCYMCSGNKKQSAVSLYVFSFYFIK